MTYLPMYVCGQFKFFELLFKANDLRRLRPTFWIKNVGEYDMDQILLDLTASYFKTFDRNF